jgi:hypothetical protein
MFIGLVLIATACSGSGDGETAPPSTTLSTTSTTGAPAPPEPPETPEPGDTINAALGGTQAVQDFAIHIGIQKRTGTGAVDIYQAVLDEARPATEDLVQLAGGFIFTPATGLSAEVRADGGESLPSLAVDFGLLGATPATAAEARDEVIAALPSDAIGEELAGLLVEEGSVGGELLVEIVTADFAERRLHVGLGDRSLLDMSFVDSVAPGDALSTMYVFGQTLPGDPEAETGLDPLALFAHRWNQGLVRVLGEDGAVTLVIDDTATAVEGSTVYSREVKARKLMAAFQAGARQTIADRVLPVLLNDDGAAFTVNGRLRARRTTGTANELCNAVGCVAVSDTDFEDDADSDLGVMTVPSFTTMMALAGGLAACAERAAQLNERNRAAAVMSTITGLTTDFGRVQCGSQSSAGGPLDPFLPVGTMTGDVHLRTFDGRSYDNQATGEFLVFDDDTTIVQARLEPWPGRDWASIATAFAVAFDGHSVSVDLDGRTLLDGQLAGLPRGEAVGLGSGSVLRWDQGWVIVGSDGTVIKIQDVATALLLVVEPATRVATGLLGNLDGDPDNDFVTRDGMQLDGDADGDFEAFYAPGGFVDSWRIGADESLFHYEDGETTAGFTIAGFPSRPSSLVEIPLEDVSRAEEVCRQTGVTRDDALEDCVFDVALTGEPSFAYAAFLAQQATPDSVVPPVDEAPVDIVRPSVEGGSVVAFDDVVIQFGPDPPIVDPSGVRPRWQCTVDETSFFATSSFTETPTRNLAVAIEYLDATRSSTGEARLTVTVTLNNEDYAWALSYDDRFAGMSIALDAGTLSASGTGYLNEPLDTGLHPIVALPDDATLSKFTLVANCPA